MIATIDLLREKPLYCSLGTVISGRSEGSFRQSSFAPLRVQHMATVTAITDQMGTQMKKDGKGLIR